MNMIIWKLEIEIIGDDWENTEKYFFKTIKETKAFQEKYWNAGQDAQGVILYL